MDLQEEGLGVAQSGVADLTASERSLGDRGKGLSIRASSCLLDAAVLEITMNRFSQRLSGRVNRILGVKEVGDWAQEVRQLAPSHSELALDDGNCMKICDHLISVLEDKKWHFRPWRRRW